MKPFNIKEFSEKLNFEKGIINDKQTIDAYISMGYSPNEILKDFHINNNDTLMYALTKAAIEKTPDNN